MPAQSAAPPFRKPALTARRIVLGAGVAALLAAMALDVRVVSIGSDEDVRTDAFSPQQFGAEKFPEIRSLVEERAVEAATLARTIAEDRKAAGEQYGTPAGIGPVMPVRFTGVAGEETAGNYDVKIEGVPGEVRVRVQTGPAINGTELRDFPGDIAFGAFKNQIEYQNAGAGINDAMKAEALADVDTGKLTGETISVVGVFKLINPKNWLVTPVRFSVE